MSAIRLFRRTASGNYLGSFPSSRELIAYSSSTVERDIVRIRLHFSILKLLCLLELLAMPYRKVDTAVHVLKTLDFWLLRTEARVRHP